MSDPHNIINISHSNTTHNLVALIIIQSIHSLLAIAVTANQRSPPYINHPTPSPISAVDLWHFWSNIFVIYHSFMPIIIIMACRYSPAPLALEVVCTQEVRGGGNACSSWQWMVIMVSFGAFFSFRNANGVLLCKNQCRSFQHLHWRPLQTYTNWQASNPQVFLGLDTR